MNAELRILHTKAEEELAAMFRAERNRAPAGQGSWRDDAFARFERAGLPHRRVESWKYTDLRALLRSVPPLAREPSHERLKDFLLRDRLPDITLVVDAGLGAPSHAAQALELGYDAVLLNTAIAKAADPVAMASAFRLGVEAGRTAYQAGLMQARDFASPSTPVIGTPFWHAVS